MPKTSDQAPAAEAPAPSAPEPARGRAIFESAKAELKSLDQSPSPADKEAPEPAAAPPDSTQAPQAETPAPAEPDKPATTAEKPESSRREGNRALREQIRREIKAEYEADQRAAQQRQQNEQQQREFEDLVARGEAGDFEAKDRVLQILRSQKGMQTAIMQGRTAVLEELGRDITTAIYSLDGLDEEAQAGLMKAPSVADFGKLAFEHGRRIERTVHESTEATLKAEIESLKGRLAGNGPSPTPTNGSQVTRGQPQRFQSMRDAFEASAAELGYRVTQR